MPVVLYHFPLSAPSRAALLTFRVLGLDVDIKEINLVKKEQLSDEYIKINPQHTVPTIDDDGFYLWESKAIAGYLVQKYGNNDSLYPKDPKKKAIVDRILYFDIGTLYAKIRAAFFPVIFLQETVVPEEKKKDINDALLFLNDHIIGNNKWVAGSDMTIADLSVATSVSNLKATGWDLSRLANVTKWLNNCEKEIPDYYESNQKGAELYGQLVLKNLAKGQVFKA